MRFTWLFLLLLALTAGLGAVLWFYPETDRSITLCIVCAIALMLLVLFYYLSKSVRTFSCGMDLLKAQDFGSRLAKVGQRETDMVVDTFNKMMDTLKVERLFQNEQLGFLSQMLDVSALGVVMMDFDNERVTSANRAALRFLDIDPTRGIIGYRLRDLSSEMARRMADVEIGKSITYRHSDTMVYRLSRREYMERGFRRWFITIESLTDEVHKAEKSAYEKVIRMIVHEVNNTMAGMRSLMETLSDVVDDGDIRELIESCQERSKSLSMFITSFADVIKIPPLLTERVDMNVMLRSWMPFLESMAPSGVKFEIDVSDKPVFVEVDRVLMEQVMVNIVKNAVESVDGAGTVRISTSGFPSAITITDNGPGISDEVSQHIFTPFFSTKANGQGLGLMLVSEILRRHKCRFSLRTNHDSGLTSFEIVFPQQIAE